MKSCKVLSVMLVGLMVLATSGCNLTPGQIKVIARNSGLYSAVGWISLDDPTTNQIAAVESLLDVISTNASNIGTGETYTEVIYPILVPIIDTKVDKKDRPICKAGAISLLGGIDMLFIANPEWVKNQELAVQIVDAFIEGAKIGLSMAEDHPVMIQARKTVAKRVAAKKIN